MMSAGQLSSFQKDNNNNGRINLINPNLAALSEDVLYHFALSTGTHNLKEMFGDVKFVVVGGSARRMEAFAHLMLKELDHQMPAGQALTNIASAADRYVMYKVGPVLSVSHGMGIPSVAIMLHEILKLVHHAECTNVTFVRIGTSGGLGLEPGTVVVTESAVDGMLNANYELPVLGKLVSRPSNLDQKLAKEIAGCARSRDKYDVVLGKTMCTLDFYEGQGRLDGAFCDYTEEEKMMYLRQVYERGVRNIEMESLCFAAMCYQANIKGAVVCVTLVDRFKGDQIDAPHDITAQWNDRPAEIVARFIKKRLGTAN